MRSKTSRGEGLVPRWGRGGVWQNPPCQFALPIHNSGPPEFVITMKACPGPRSGIDRFGHLSFVIRGIVSSIRPPIRHWYENALKPLSSAPLNPKFPVLVIPGPLDSSFPRRRESTH